MWTVLYSYSPSTGNLIHFTLNMLKICYNLNWLASQYLQSSFLLTICQLCPPLDGSNTAHHMQGDRAVRPCCSEGWIGTLSPITSNQSGGESVVLIQQESEPIREKWGCRRLMTVCLNPSVSDTHTHTHTHTQKHRPDKTNYSLRKTYIL